MIIEETLEQMRSPRSEWPYVFGDDEFGSTCHMGSAARPEAVPPGSQVGTARLHLANVSEVFGSVNGANDESDFVAVMRMYDGRFACIRAGCDYTGWG